METDGLKTSDDPEPHTRPGCSYFGRTLEENDVGVRHTCNTQKYYIKCNSSNTSWSDINDETLRGNWTDCWIVGKPVKIIVHGYTPETKLNETFDDDPEALLERRLGTLFHIANDLRDSGDFNVIILDWHIDAQRDLLEESHPKAYTTILRVSKCLQQFLQDIIQEPKYNELAEDRPQPKDIHMIAFSIGVHVASMVRNDDLDHEKPLYFGRLTGIDPEGGVFSRCTFVNGSDTKASVVRGHVKIGCAFVEIYHCNAGCRKVPGSDHSGITDVDHQGRYGSPITAGHVDIFVNNGVHQPGCDNSSDEAEHCSQNACLEFYRGNLKQNVTACQIESGSLLSGNITSDCEKRTLELGIDTDEFASGLFQYISNSTCSGDECLDKDEKEKAR